MSLHVTCGLVAETQIGPQQQPLEIGGSLDWSETLLSPGTTTQAVPAGAQPRVLTLVARVDMFVSIAASPNAAADPRRLIPAGGEKSFRATPGLRVSWVAA